MPLAQVLPRRINLFSTKKWTQETLIIRFSSSTNSNSLIFEEKNNTGIITLNRPESMNVLSSDMGRKIFQKLRDWETGKNLIILKGTGNKAFCCGGDVRELITQNTGATFAEAYKSFSLIGRYQKPIVTLMNGMTMGAGMGLAINSKYRVATDQTMCAMPETAIGLIPDATGSFFLSRLQGKLGLYLGMTGHRLRGQEVVKAGLATHYTSAEQLTVLENELVETNGAQVELENVLTKHNQLDNEPFVLQQHMNLLNECFSAKTVEGIVERLKKYIEEDDTDVAKGALWSISKMSPTSLKVTKRQLESGAKLTLDECIKMEFRIITRMLEYGDFKEGVRAKLIDKDHEPKWSPATLEEVADDYVESFFAKMMEEKEIKL